MTAKEYWNELNEMYGLDLEMPKNLLDFDSAEIANDIAMGMTFDGATQKNMD